MYQIYAVTPGYAKLNHVLHGDKLEVCTGVDQVFHSSVNVVVWFTDHPPPQKEPDDLYGFYCADSKLMTFIPKTTVHVVRDYDPGESLPIYPIMLVVRDGEEAVVFEGTKTKMLYHSRGHE